MAVLQRPGCPSCPSGAPHLVGRHRADLTWEVGGPGRPDANGTRAHCSEDTAGQVGGHGTIRFSRSPTHGSVRKEGTFSHGAVGPHVRQVGTPSRVAGYVMPRPRRTPRGGRRGPTGRQAGRPPASPRVAVGQQEYLRGRVSLKAQEATLDLTVLPQVEREVTCRNVTRPSKEPFSEDCEAS